MNNYSFKKGGKIYRRISKATARKLHAQRSHFVFAPATVGRARPGTPSFLSATMWWKKGILMQ